MDNKWLIIGGLGVAAAGILYFATKSGSTSGTSTGQQFTPSSVLSNTGTPANNGSLLGFVDSTTGVLWTLNANDQWAANLPQGTLPPNYIAGQAYLNGSPIAVTP